MAVLASGQDPVTLDQNNVAPVTVPLGSPLTLKCNLTRPNQNRRRMSWHFKRTEPSNKTRLSNVVINTEDLDITMFQVASSAAEGNSGWYSCEVTIEIPRFIHVESAARHVVISKYCL